MNIMSGKSVDFSRTLLFLRNSLSGHPPTTGHGTFFSFTPVVDYRVIVMGIFLDNLAGDKRVIYLNINTLR